MKGKHYKKTQATKTEVKGHAVTKLAPKDFLAYCMVCKQKNAPSTGIPVMNKETGRWKLQGVCKKAGHGVVSFTSNEVLKAWGVQNPPPKAHAEDDGYGSHTIGGPVKTVKKGRVIRALKKDGTPTKHNQAELKALCKDMYAWMHLGKRRDLTLVGDNDIYHVVLFEKGTYSIIASHPYREVEKAFDAMRDYLMENADW